VILNPKGKEFGSIEVKLTNQGIRDPLFKGLGGKITVASSHKCMAKNLKSSWKLLAFSGLCRVQALAIGNRIRLLQFHPEMKANSLLGLAHMRGLKGNTDLIKTTGKDGKKILRNFLDYFVLPRVIIK